MAFKQTWLMSLQSLTLSLNAACDALSLLAFLDTSIALYVFLQSIFQFGDFPGVPVIGISPSSAGVWVPSLVGELRSHMPLGQKPKHKAEAILYQIQ